MQKIRRILLLLEPILFGRPNTRMTLSGTVRTPKLDRNPMPDTQAVPNRLARAGNRIQGVGKRRRGCHGPRCFDFFEKSKLFFIAWRYKTIKTHQIILLMHSNLSENCLFISKTHFCPEQSKTKTSGGSLCFSRCHLKSSWGRESGDLRTQLSNRGCRSVVFPNKYTDVLPLSDADGTLPRRLEIEIFKFSERIF